MDRLSSPFVGFFLAGGERWFLFRQAAEFQQADIFVDPINGVGTNVSRVSKEEGIVVKKSGIKAVDNDIIILLNELLLPFFLGFFSHPHFVNDRRCGDIPSKHRVGSIGAKVVAHDPVIKPGGVLSDDKEFFGLIGGQV